ncbi:MAG TPA: glutamine amidotransferase family protein [Chthoniobacterales bacterium]|nr:glutamine amidotransferase family protein [Chthoniobacterales bacterium]
MCGIVGLFFKNEDYEQELGRLFAPMLETMCGRGPDSAGFAVYNGSAPEGWIKVSLQHPDLDYDWRKLISQIESRGNAPVHFEKKSTHAMLIVPAREEDLRVMLAELDPEVTIMSMGRRIQIMKETGTPQEVVERFDVRNMTGSHAIGHTRMATESAVSTAGSHPFSTGMDLCLVHNGSLSNHNRLRENLKKEGIEFRTENDTEVAAGYFTWRLRQGMSLEEALQAGLKDLDGFYTFAIGTAEGFAVLRDPIACKPAVMAETDDYVAMASEYRSLASLPGIENARLWEPEPGVVYSWSRA